MYRIHKRAHWNITHIQVGAHRWDEIVVENKEQRITIETIVMTL